MTEKIYTTIAGTGSYLPSRKIGNRDFLGNVFHQPDGTMFDKDPEDIIQKFEEITEIEERKFVTDDLVTSDISYFAAKNALESSGIDKESLDYIIVAHNFGDVQITNKRSDFVPSLAARVKHKLGIENPKAIAYDIAFGCPGWLQAVILEAKKSSGPVGILTHAARSDALEFAYMLQRSNLA